MKKVNFLTYAAFVAAFAVFTSCDDDEKAPSALTEDAIAVQSNVCGYVQYSYKKWDKKESAAETEYDVKDGAIVRVEYTIETAKTDKDGNPVKMTLYKEVKSKSDGFYDVSLVVPMGKSADVKVSTNFREDSYKVNKLDSDDSDEVSCNFYGTAQTTVSYGQRVVLNINAAEAGAIDGGYFGDSEGK